MTINRVQHLTLTYHRWHHYVLELCTLRLCFARCNFWWPLSSLANRFIHSDFEWICRCHGMDFWSLHQLLRRRMTRTKEPGVSPPRLPRCLTYQASDGNIRTLDAIHVIAHVLCCLRVNMLKDVLVASRKIVIKWFIVNHSHTCHTFV